MSTEKMSIGTAIDHIVGALNGLDKKEQQTVITTVCTFLDLVPQAFTSQMGMQPVQSQTANPHTGHVPPAVVHHPSTSIQHGLDIRSLKEQKQPDSARQMACLVAYYLLDHAPEGERKQTLNSADLEKYFKQAGYKLPAKLEQLLIDCKKSGYVETVARGEYKLTRVGYNLITHSMPKGGKS